MSGTEGGPRLVSVEEVREAAKRLRGVARRTPLLPTGLPMGAEERRTGKAQSGPRVWLKCENFQHVSAFKIRGAYNFVSQVPAERRSAGLVTYSSGNHAQGVAFAARAFGLGATIVMPEDAPRVKLEGTLALGARVEQAGITVPDRSQRAEEIRAESGAVMVPPFDHPHVIAGQGTVGLEIVEQLREALERGEASAAGGSAAGEAPEAAETPGAEEGEEASEPALVLVPIGGGGLISGVAAAVRGLVPGARIVGVEPEGAASMGRSLEAGEPVTLDSVHSVADGLKPVRPGDQTFHHVRELVERVVTVTDEEIREATMWLFRRRLVAEPSGAATVAALLSGRIAPAERGETVAVVSGGNIDPDLYASWLAG